MKDLYTNVNAKVLFSGRQSRSFPISQSTGQGRILAPFMYKLYINSLLNELSEHNFAICISGMKLSVPSFADDISLLVLYPTFLQHFMNIAYEYSLKWQYEFNNIKSGTVTYVESKPFHFANMQERSWTLGVENVDELYEYKSLGVYKNHCGSFNAKSDENIEKTRKKAGMIFSANIDRHKTNHLIDVKYWKQGCLPSLLFGSEIFFFTPTLLSRLERCQRWFLKIIFHVPKFASSIFIERLAGVNSVESEFDYCKLLFIGRLLSVQNLPVTVKTLFRTRIESFYDEKYHLLVSFLQFLRHCVSMISEFIWKNGVWKKLVKERIIFSEKDRWSDRCLNHPNIEISRLFLENVPTDTFWSISNKFPDLVKHLDQQVRLIANYGLNDGVPWLCGTNGALCFFCKDKVEDCSHFFLGCKTFKANFGSLWQNLNSKILLMNPTNGTFICSFLNNLDQNNKILFLLGGLPLPFEVETSIMIRRFVPSAVGKICKMRTDKLCEQEAPLDGLIIALTFVIFVIS